MKLQTLTKLLEQEVHLHQELQLHLKKKQKAILSRNMPFLSELNALIDAFTLEAEDLKKKREFEVKQSCLASQLPMSPRLSELLTHLNPSDQAAIRPLYESLLDLFQNSERLCQQNRLLSQRLLHVALGLIECLAPGQNMQVYGPQGSSRRVQTNLMPSLDLLA
jgi:hypothetical protein